MTHGTIWMNLEDTMLTEISQITKRQQLFDSIYMMYLKWSNSCSPGTGGEEKGELLNKRYRVTVLQDEKVLEICFTTKCIYLTLLHLKIVKISF